MTEAERTFFARVAAHMVENNISLDGPGNIERACKEVLKRDEEIWLEVARGTKVGKAISSALCETVYKACRT